MACERAAVACARRVGACGGVRVGGKRGGGGAASGRWGGDGGARVAGTRAGRIEAGGKKIKFWGHKHPLTYDLHGSSPALTSVRSQCEEYDGPDLNEKNFQLFFIFIV